MTSFPLRLADRGIEHRLDYSLSLLEIERHIPSSSAGSACLDVQLSLPVLTLDYCRLIWDQSNDKPEAEMKGGCSSRFLRKIGAAWMSFLNVA